MPGNHKAGVDGEIEIDEAAIVARTVATSLLTTAETGVWMSSGLAASCVPRTKGGLQFLWEQSCIVAVKGRWACGLPCRTNHDTSC